MSIHTGLSLFYAMVEALEIPRALDTGFGVASVLSEETHQADTANHRVDCFEGDAWRASGSVEDFGASSLVARLCLWVAEDSRVEGCYWSWLGGQRFALGPVRSNERRSAKAEVSLHHGQSSHLF